MRTKLFCALLFLGLTGGVAVVSPSNVFAQTVPGDGESGDCRCVGGCDGYVYYNPCPNNMCSLQCSA